MKKKYKFRIMLKWGPNDRGDIRPVGIYYTDEADKKRQIAKIIHDCKTKPIEHTGNPDYDIHEGEIPYAVTTKIPDLRPEWLRKLDKKQYKK